MLTNKEILKINKDSIIYFLIFFLYGTVSIFCFLYSVKFLGQTLNIAFSVPEMDEIEAKYGQLRLDEYALVATKLNLVQGSVPEVISTVESATNLEKTATTTLPN